ncbi:hypothetical protein EB796_000496 [Bugula neritina]|uniref:Uncharacterized protein n=1 Tax=Bugula neritina TaxID=10212 RepID=A0A7J7KSX0_BUGNE|nr:hypothetical protein EB796_000496 [Bugula neritina]
MQDDENSTQLYQLKLEKCKRGNELSLLALTLAVYRSQENSLTFSSKVSGEEGTEIKSGAASSNGGGKSIKAMWKRFAFKAAKAKNSSLNGSLPTSENSTQNISSESQYNESSVLESSEGNTDPVYALLRCAATIRKNSALESEGVRSKQSITTSLDNNNKSRSSSPCQEYEQSYHSTSLHSERSMTYQLTCTVASCPCKHPDVLQDYCKQHLLRYKSKKRKK